MLNNNAFILCLEILKLTILIKKSIVCVTYDRF